MRPAASIPLATCLQQMPRVSMDRIEHAVSWLAVGQVSTLLLPDEAVLHQLGERLQRQTTRLFVAPHHLDITQATSTLEDAQAAKQRLLSRREELVAPVNRRGERPLARRQVAHVRAQRGDVGREAVEQECGRMRGEAHRDQLNRERQVIAQAAELYRGGALYRRWN